MTRWLWSVLFSLTVLAIASAQEPAKDHTRQRDVIYGRKHGVCLTMDVFAPKENKNGAAIIAVVSGGWISDHRSIDFFYPLLGAELMKRGYTVFAVVHGSQPKYCITECIEDVHRAVRFIRHNAKEYGVEPNRIGISGASAGCHLSLMIGVGGEDGDAKAADAVNRASSRVQAVAGFFPPTDFFNWGTEGKSADGVIRTGPFAPAFDFRERDRTNNWKPVSDEKRKDILKQISPIYHVTERTPPTLLVHGDKDGLVPVQQSHLMIAKLKEQKVPCDLIVREGGGHGWIGIDRESRQIIDWFDKYLKR